ncbi:hypothetical protein L249_5978 [Ophiocordyceps polyrhachis-furcata BCC 54312]|uniref:Uncharacterized protein n=1 Tax=Ophiocordyceps polyrhachis-furcata BCC 54312 TaxID=1330021 RepID=A0A367LIS4_9HYPO|nr:hypothetical protein L249_5978 [Ophiocordyceps polyrhachis-furcata BCC 54312]RCI14338.1 hypothetical protein L249_5978 [Ophiocordyceps polyrhachis-furcata BCC 54312]
MPFLPLLCDVRRPRAGYGRPGVTVSGAPAKLLPIAKDTYTEANYIAKEGTPCLSYFKKGSLTYPMFLPSYGPYGPYGPSVTYGGLGPATAGPASQCLALPPN